jgi:hypothetical protein
MLGVMDISINEHLERFKHNSSENNNVVKFPKFRKFGPKMLPYNSSRVLNQSALEI